MDLTHDLLSLMLGVRRAGVTTAVHLLEGQGLVKATRGRIHVLDRAGLKSVTHGLYGVPEAEYARLMNGTGAGSGPSQRPGREPMSGREARVRGAAG